MRSLPGIVAALVLALSIAGAGAAYAAGLETTVTPVAGSVPVSIDATSAALIAEALHGLAVEATVTSLPAATPVTFETTVPVSLAGIEGVSPAGFSVLLVVAGACLGAGLFYSFVRVWGADV